MSDNGSISKLVIKAYADDQFSSCQGEFTASINPENLKISSSIDYAMSQGMGAPGMALRYNTSGPRVLSFKLLFDNTGVIPGSEANVKDQLDRLKQIIYDFQADIHAPYYIRIIWGVIDFKGRLGSLETSYTLFRLDGSPIRAQADIAIIENIEPISAAQASKAQAANKVASSSASESAQSQANSSTTVNQVGGVAAVTHPGQNADHRASQNTSQATNATTTSDTDKATSAQEKDSTNEEKKQTADSEEAANQESELDEDPDQEVAAQEEPNSELESDEEPLAEGHDTSEQDAYNDAAVHEVKEGETLPAISNKALKDPNLAKKLGSLNALDSLRALAAGLKLGMPFSLAALLAALLAKAAKYAKKGAKVVKKKALKAERKM